MGFIDGVVIIGREHGKEKEILIRYTDCVNGSLIKILVSNYSYHWGHVYGYISTDGSRLIAQQVCKF